MGFIVYQEILLRHARSKMRPHEGEHDVLGLYLRAQRAVCLGKAHETLVEMRFVAQVPNGVQQFAHRIVGEHVHHGSAFQKADAQKVQNEKLLVRVAGQKSAPHERQRLGAYFLRDGAKHPVRLRLVGLHDAHGQKERRTVLKRGHVERELLFIVAFEHAAEEPLKAAVVTVN